MQATEMTPNEIVRAGLEAVARELGPVGFIRFVQHFDPGYGDYTAEREQLPAGVTRDEILEQIRKMRESGAS